MPVSQAPSATNQIAFAFMSESDVFPLNEAGGAHSGESASEAGGASGLWPVVSVAAAGGTVLLALVASAGGQPLLLTILASLAMLGIFFLFGVVAGHIRLGERVRSADIAEAITGDFEDGLVVTRADGSLVYANTGASDLLGRTPAGDLVALEQAFAGEPHATEALFRLTRAAANGEPWREEFPVRQSAAGPGQRLLRVAVRPLRVRGHERDTGPLTRWSIADVTDERAREAHELEAVQATLAHYDAAPAGFLHVAPNGVVDEANATFLRWAGLEPGALESRTLKLADLLHADAIALLHAAARRGGYEPEAVELDVTSESGKRVPMRLAARRDGAGALVIAAFNRETDADDPKDRDAAGARVARFFQSAPFGIASVGADGRILSANAAFARMVLDETSGIGDPAIDVLCRTAEPQARAELEAALKQALSGRPNPTPLEIATGPQKEFVRRVYLSSLAETKGGREAAVLYVIDATEQKSLEAKFAQSSKMEAVGKLAGGIAHDFNNVLTAIIGFSDLLLQTHRPADPAYKDIMNIKSSASRAAGLVAKLLAFSRRQTLQTERLQLGEVLTDLAPLLKRSIGERIELKVSTARDLWYVKTDKIQFDQVVINLAVNARDAMPDGGTLFMRTRNITERDSQKLNHPGMPVGEFVLIEVEDTGTGMSPEVLSKIFEPFFTTKGVGKGTGLGLATVYGIVKQSGGFIYADSKVGKGTVFRVYLPRYLPESEEEVAGPKEKKKERQADLTGTGRVLLVEDEDIVRSFAVRALKRQGYEVLEATTGVEALEVMAANEGRIDIVVSDVVMPEMDGPTMLKELRKKNKDLKIIFVSGYPHEAFETSLDKDETFAFLPKPFSLPQLAAKVKEQLGR